MRSGGEMSNTVDPTDITWDKVCEEENKELNKLLKSFDAFFSKQRRFTPGEVVEENVGAMYDG